MTNFVRTAEDHNGDGNQVPPRPRFYTRLDASNLTATVENETVAVATHTLQEDTSVALYLFKTEQSSLCDMPTESGTGTWRLPVNLLWSSSELGARTLDITFQGTDLSMGPDVTLEIWEY